MFKTTVLEPNRINKGFKVRIYPSPEQEIYLNKNFGCCRFLYNTMLSERINFYNENKDDKEKIYSHKYKTEKDYKEEFEFLKEVDSVALMIRKIDLLNAFQNFYRGLKIGKKVGFPHFQSRHDSHNNRFSTYRTNDNIKIDFSKREIKIPKCKPIKFRHQDINDWYKKDTTEIKSVTITKSPTGKYYASFLFEGDKDFLKVVIPSENKVIGLDMSLQNFYIDDAGNSPIGFSRLYRNYEKKLCLEQRRLSRKPKGSKNWEKQKLKVAKVHEKIKNRRNNFNHQLSKNLVDNYDVIVVETLSIKGMSQALRLGKSVMDLGYSSFITMLKYKCEWYGKHLVFADKWFASSKTCNQCGYKNKDLKLSTREWTCPVCNTHHNRDKNAAINLQSLGINLLRLEQSEVTPMEFKTSVLREKSVNISLNGEVGNNVSDNRSHQF